MTHSRDRDPFRRIAVLLLIMIVIAAALASPRSGLMTTSHGGLPTSGHDGVLVAPSIVSPDGHVPDGGARVPIVISTHAADPNRFAFNLAIHARDLDDRPAPGVAIWVAPDGHELGSARTGADGVLCLRWSASVPRMRVVWTSPQDGTEGSRLRRTEVQAGVPATVALRVVHGPPGDGGGVVPMVDVEGRVPVEVIASAIAAARWSRSYDITPMPVDEDGVCLFVAGSDVPPEVDAALAELVGRVEVSLWSSAVGLGGHGVSSGTPRPTGRVMGVVRDARGQAVRDTLVVCSAEETSGEWATRTGADGTFAFDGIQPGTYVLRAGGGDRGVAKTGFSLAPGAGYTWDAVLDRGHELSGSLIDLDGRPLVNWDVEAVPENGGEPWIDGTRTDAAGRFAIPNVPLRPHRLRAAPVGAPLGIVYVRGVEPDRGEPCFAVPIVTGRLAQLTLDARRPNGGRDRFVELRIWNDVHDEGARARNGASGTIDLRDLPDGTLRVVALGPGVAPIDFGRVDARGGGTAQLGPVPLGERTILALPVDGGSEVRVPVVGLHANVTLDAGTLTADHPRRALPPGRYRLAVDEATWVDLGPGETRVDIKRVRAASGSTNR